jgi:hypothetical protein
MKLMRWMNVGNFRLVLAVVFALCALVTSVEAQTTAQERANRLRELLVKVLAQQEALEVRLLQLEEQLKPENIEKSLAGIGSTRPEELRELRRRQLDLERSSVEKQLKQLANSRTRLEASIVDAEAAAYHQSAFADGAKPPPSGQKQPPPSGQKQIDDAQSLQRPRRARQKRPVSRGIRRSVYE